MSERTLAALALGIALAAVLAVQVIRPWRRARRHARLMRSPLPAHWRRLVRDHVALYPVLPPELRTRLDGLIQVFLDDKRFVGCAGLVVNDTMRVLIAAHACLLLVNRRGGLFDSLQTILVYPTAFYVDHEEVDDTGLVHRDRHLRSGESWEEGQVVVSWDDAVQDVAHPCDGQNVVLHEFAHQVDSESGAISEAPARDDGSPLARWAGTMRAEFDALVRATERGEKTFIDPYGATNQAEFFAVVTELFFESPGQLRDAHPPVYRCLREFYRIDPASWPAATPARRT